MKTLNEKFQSLVNGSTHYIGGVCGTNQDVRVSIVNEVYAALGNKTNCKINDVVVCFTKHTSLSGKTTYFSSSLTNEEYLSIVPNAPFKKKGGASIMLDPNGKIEIRNGGNFFVILENKNCEISIVG